MLYIYIYICGAYGGVEGRIDAERVRMSSMFDTSYNVSNKYHTYKYKTNKTSNIYEVWYNTDASRDAGEEGGARKGAPSQAAELDIYMCITCKS